MMAQRMPLRTVAYVFRGTVPANTVETPTDIRFFGMAEVTTSGSAAPRYVAEDVDLRTPPVWLETGDVVVATAGKPPGRAALVGPSQSGAVLGRECAVIRPKARPGQLLGGWFAAWTHTQDYLDQVEANTTGSTIRRLSVRALEEFLVPVPHIDEQLRIQDLIQGIDRTIMLGRQAMDQLEQLKEVEVDLRVARLLSEPKPDDRRRITPRSRRPPGRSQAAAREIFGERPTHSPIRKSEPRVTQRRRPRARPLREDRED